MKKFFRIPLNKAIVQVSNEKTIQMIVSSPTTILKIVSSQKNKYLIDQISNISSNITFLSEIKSCDWNSRVQQAKIELIRQRPKLETTSNRTEIHKTQKTG